MRKLLGLLVGMAMLGTPALAQVRPQDCRPVLPVVDQSAAIPQDVVAERAVPASTAKRRFFGLPFLLPLLAVGAGAVALGGGGGGGGPTVSPA
jgi:hypothetical protein